MSAVEPVPFAHALGLEVLSLGELFGRIPPRHFKARSRPDFHQIFWVESGSIEQLVDFEQHRATSGCLLHLRAGQVQQFVHRTAPQGSVLLFRPEFVPPEPLLETGPWPVVGPLIRLDAPRRAAFAQLVQALATLQEAGDARAMQLVLTAALLLIVRHEARSTPRPSTTIYDRFIRELERGFAHRHAVADYLRPIGCSAKSLARACQAAIGTSPKGVIEQRIVLEAKRLLAHSTMSVSAIGLELGFDEPTNFGKFFRRREGMTPLAFRQRATR